MFHVPMLILVNVSCLGTHSLSDLLAPPAGVVDIGIKDQVQLGILIRNTNFVNKKVKEI